MDFAYLCPKCGEKMWCLAVATNPPYYYYQCPACHYKSKEEREQGIAVTLPEYLQKEQRGGE